jgi:hypothetical protein
MTLHRHVADAIKVSELSISGNPERDRTYNSLFQLTRITVPGALDIQYAYSATQNPRKLTSQTDAISGEQITYTYDR